MHGVETEDDETSSKPILADWELVGLNSTSVEISLNFTENFQVSSKDEPDLLLVQFDLSQYTTKNNQVLQPVVKTIMVPRQMASQEEAEQVESSGDTASSSSFATTVINFLVSLLTSNSLGQVWDLIEGLQVTVVLPLFDAKTPGNVQTFIEGLENLASFDLIPDEFTQWWMFIPESQALSLNF